MGGNTRIQREVLSLPAKTMIKLIIIRGPLGVGKSTVATKLAQELNAYYVSIDSILKENDLDKVEGEGIPIKNFLKGNEIAMPQIKEALEDEKPVIVDGCFYHKEQIEHFIENLPVEHIVFTLKAPVETCISRDKGKDLSYGEGAAMAVHNMVSRFDYGTIIETEGQTLNQTLNEITQHLQ